MIDPNFIIGVLVGLFAGLSTATIYKLQFWLNKINHLDSLIEEQEKINQVCELILEKRGEK